MKWRIAILVSIAISISYADRQALPVAIKAVQADIPISNLVKSFLDTAFLAAYGLMYLGGGRLLDKLGTRRGFMLVMLFWSLACASQGLATGVAMLAVSRLLLGLGEGGGFPAATRVAAEWFEAKDRSTAMGIMNAGTAVGAVAAGPVITLVILPHVHWLGLAGWRWTFFLAGAMGLLWLAWWIIRYSPPVKAIALEPLADSGPLIPLRQLLSFRETRGVVLAKFLTDAAWYFYLFWLPKYLYDARHFDFKATGTVVWIPPAASGLGALIGGTLSSRLAKGGTSINASRKIALGLSAAIMPCVMLVPAVSVPWAIALFSVVYFGQQSWSTLIMTLPTDLFPQRAVGTVAGLVGFGGAMGGCVLGTLAGYMLDHGVGYGPVLAIAGSLHVAAFVVILVMVPVIRPLYAENWRAQVVGTEEEPSPQPSP